MTNDYIGSMQTIRTFVALPLSSEASDKLETALAPIIASRPSFRWTPVAQWHITLRFLGPTPLDNVPKITESLKHIAKEFAPILISFNKIGAFPDWKDASSLWVGVDGRLKTLHQKIMEMGPLADDARPFVPHVTIARVKRKTKPFEVPEIEGARWIAEHLVLYQSEPHKSGSIYTPLAVHPLG